MTPLLLPTYGNTADRKCCGANCTKWSNNASPSKKLTTTCRAGRILEMVVISPGLTAFSFAHPAL